MDRSSRCPICKGAVIQVEGAWPATFPFCSDRCRLVDLGQWLGEKYRVPAETQPGDDPDVDGE